jgi:2-succinyl-6-hydroxy-2,4-cyclohexadiene-1-carboxylate synthase
VDLIDIDSTLPPLAFERRGEGSRIVLVHGFTQTGESWRQIADILAASHEVLTPDLPGHGQSPAALGDLDTAATQLGETCGGATYVGYSLGGRVCLHLALSQPDIVERLVLVSTTAGIDDLGQRADRLATDEALAKRIESEGDEGVASFIDEWLSGPLFRDLGSEAADRPSRLSNTPAGLAGSLRHHGTGAQLPLWERLGEVSVPTLLVTGENDVKFTSLGERMALAIGPLASLILVPGAGHAAPFEQPVAFARLLGDFADGDAGPGSGDTP